MGALHAVCRSKSSFVHFNKLPRLFLSQTEKKQEKVEKYLKYTYFCVFLVSFSFETEKDRKTCLNAKKDNFNQKTACKAPICCLKYTTAVSFSSLLLVNLCLLSLWSVFLPQTLQDCSCLFICSISLCSFNFSVCPSLSKSSFDGAQRVSSNNTFHHCF